MIDRDKVARAIGSIDVGPDMMAHERKWIEGDEIKRQPWPDYYLRHADAAIAAVLEQLREPSEGLAGHLVSRANILSASSAWGFDGDAYLMLQAADRIRELEPAFLQPPESTNPAE